MKAKVSLTLDDALLAFVDTQPGVTRSQKVEAALRRGDIWTVALPTFAKPRPALVVSIDPINDLRPDILVAPITSRAGPLREPLQMHPPQPGFARSAS